MKITVFTSNQPRHLFLLKQLSMIADEVFAIQECNTVFPGKIKDFYNNSSVMQQYFAEVISSEKYLFGDVDFLPTNVRQLVLKSGDVNFLDFNILKPALLSDFYIVFGASYIKPPLVNFLINKRAINIHMGVSPYFRGSATNFWALYKKRYDMVGATIHLLSTGLDSGDILYHALPKAQAVSPFLLGMEAVKVAIMSIKNKLNNNEIFNTPALQQNRELELLYSKSSDFTDEIAQIYLENLPSPEEIYKNLQKRDVMLYYKPYLG